jgi:hypothetical protein
MHRVLRLAPVHATLLVGCAAPLPSSQYVDPALSPEQIVRALSNRKLASRGTSNDGFGLATFKAFLRPLDVRCQAGGGYLVATAPAEVKFSFRDSNNNIQEARVSMPRKLACRGSVGTLWSVEARYNETTFFPSSWADAVFYYATVPLTFELGAVNATAQADAADSCQPMRDQYTKRLRADPKVGMKVQFGVIIDVRFPMVQVQYDEDGRRLKTREQEWVQASTLSAGANCPQ